MRSLLCLSDTDIRHSSLNESKVAYLFYEKESDDSVHDEFSTTATNFLYPSQFSSFKKASSIAAEELPTSLNCSKSSTETRTPKLHDKRLINSNNFCYLISILQGLFASNVFRKHIRKILILVRGPYVYVECMRPM